MIRNGQPVLEILNLSIAFEGKRVLDQMSLRILPGEILGLVGGSGTGKTITALAVLGLLPTQAVIESGEIRYQGRNLLDFRKEELRALRSCEIAIVFQDPRTALNPVMRIDRQMSEPMRCRLGYRRHKALEECTKLLSAVGIHEPEHCLRAYPHQLSGGMRQRVLLATALSCKPRLLVCDEITSSVDSIVQSQLVALLGQLRVEHKVSILLITHDLRSLKRVSDRIAVLWQGKIVEEGTTERIFERPEHLFTQRLINCLPSVEKR